MNTGNLPQLTICIPTYNRAANVLDTLRQLRCQRGADCCQIIVVDNASEISVEGFVADADADLAAKVAFHRNVANLGLSGNILRCMEIARTEWLWILADDDIIQPDAITTILQRLEHADSLNFILFGQAPGQTGGMEVTTTAEFATTLDSWGRITFISAGVYRVKSAQSLINVGMNYAYSVVPFIAMILHGLEQKGWRVAFETFVPVVADHRATHTWSPIWSINTCLVAELVSSPATAKRLIHLAQQWALGSVGLTHDFLLRQESGTYGHSPLAYSHKIAVAGWGSWQRHLLAFGLRQAARTCPGLTLRAIDSLRKWTGRSHGSKRSGEQVFGQA